MKKYLISLFISALVLGCCKVAKEKNVLAKVNNYEITQEEFEGAFKESGFGRVDTLESRKEFLNNLINQKLILQDAQKRGLDKDKSFLRMIEKFWEQSLLKLMLDKKTNEIAGSVFVSDKTIEETYQKMLKEGRADKPYDQMYTQIKWDIASAMESRLMNKWVVDLRKKANIKINAELLK